MIPVKDYILDLADAFDSAMAYFATRQNEDDPVTKGELSNILLELRNALTNQATRIEDSYPCECKCKDD